MDGVDVIVSHWAVARPELDVSALKVFGRLHRSFLVYKARIAATFEEYDITDSGFDVLACLRRAVPENRLTAGKLAEQTLVTTGGLSLRVKRLEDAGLVTRTKDAHDARVVYVELTPEGAALVDRVADDHFAKLQTMLDGLSAEDAADLARLLGRLEDSARSAMLGDGLDPGESDPIAVG
ncbi:MarR family winged helix-turn-helix transcriptional regulator [Gordonia sp. OPL2]|uniref:MarR family winged helix-turn-helix transcriptional regulator n=1 Tax=Gordonia sp. OPL2 TaxID=2486274 RepID=UPI001654DFF0|nr:MarR family transcriptional regulator [Gordonia sp. OPL2]ROZ98126.1 MarR family transcriptional regulator [Gordonia sp. OPL2]